MGDLVYEPEVYCSSCLVAFAEFERTNCGESPTAAKRSLILNWLETFMGTEVQLYIRKTSTLQFPFVLLISTTISIYTLQLKFIRYTFLSIHLRPFKITMYDNKFQLPKLEALHHLRTNQLQHSLQFLSKVTQASWLHETSPARGDAATDRRL